MIKLLKIYQLQVRIAWELTGSVWKLRRSFKKQPEIKWNLYTYLFPVLLQNKQKSIWNSSKTNLWLTPRPILWNITSNTLRKKPGEAFQASFKLPRCGWDQRLANFNRFLQQKQCLLLYVHEQTNLRNRHRILTESPEEGLNDTVSQYFVNKLKHYYQYYCVHVQCMWFLCYFLNVYSCFIEYH